MLIWGMDEKKRIAELEKVVRDQSFTIKALEKTVAECSCTVRKQATENKR